ncbi:MAG: hypothetical protein P4L16_05295 [Chlamydiales bacterium]|nr:hypothetical protein [Chlamydiales bacterium]
MPICIFSQTIQEKKETLGRCESDLGEALEQKLQKSNEELLHLRSMLTSCYEQAAILRAQNAPNSAYQQLLEEIKDLRSDIEYIEQTFRTDSLSTGSEENHALWHQPETTVGQLIIDYGYNYVYLVSSEIAKTPVSVNSHLPIPKQSWEEMLEFILAQLGFGIKQINPYLKEVYHQKDNPLCLECITNKFDDLKLLPLQARICFIFTTGHQNPAEAYQFLSRFAHPERMQLSMMGRDIFIVGTVQEVKQLLTMHQFICSAPSGREYKLVQLSRLNPDDVEKSLAAYFLSQKEQAVAPNIFSTPNLKVLPIHSFVPALFLVGTREEILQAERIIADLEDSMQNPKEKTLFCYTCKYAQADEVADVLSRVYALMESLPTENEGSSSQQTSTPPLQETSCNTDLVINPKPFHPPTPCDDKKVHEQRENFIVDLKNSSIIMVIEKETLPSIKELLKRLDVPKKMVRIEVLLFEKKVTEEDHFGLNLLRIGGCASNTNNTCLSWFDTGCAPFNYCGPANQGILSFFLSRTRNNGIPAFDLAYNFLLAQENVQINACPSVTTINQTPAKITLVEEISLNNGTVIVDGSNCTVPYLQDSYSRAQYGIIIEMTPTIHQDNNPCNTDQKRYITLETDITFDTAKPSKVSRPDVARRNIKNQVCIPDGETVILGGLRRKTSQDKVEAIPFLGEIPGLGKLFSETQLSDQQTEMFIFLTPKIIDDTPCKLEHALHEELCKRPGDLPEFLYCLEAAKESEWQKTFSGGLNMLFGRAQECPRYYK